MGRDQVVTNPKDAAAAAAAKRIADEKRNYLLGRVAIPSWILQKRSRPFFFGGDFAVAANGSAQLNVQIDDDAHFLVEQVHIVSSDFAVATMDKATAQITDTTSGRTWSDTPVPIRDLGGDGQTPKYLI